MADWKKLCWLPILLPLFFATSCVSNKNIPYFKDISDTSSYSKIKEFGYSEPIIQTDDILSISVQTIDPQTSVVLNQIAPPQPSVGTSSATPIGSQLITGFLVDKDGSVELPMLGKVKLSGLTTFQARDLIRDRISVYFKNPTVLVRFANFRVTVLGEVAKPGTYTIPSEKASVLDVLGLAGDLTIYGKRQNLMLIREKGNEKEIVRLNLNSSDLFKSQYYYLKQNDILYIEPTKAKVAALNAQRTQVYAIIGTILTLLIVIATRVNY